MAPSEWTPIYIYIYIYIYRVFTKEFINLLNDYILQLDGAPPIFTGMYESYSIVFSNSAGSDVLQMETTTYTYYHIWDKFDYRVDVCRVTQGAYIEGL
jgi:hypothetical protein